MSHFLSLWPRARPVSRLPSARLPPTRRVSSSFWSPLLAPNWVDAFAVPQLAGFTLLALDLPGARSPRTSRSRSLRPDRSRSRSRRSPSARSSFSLTRRPDRYHERRAGHFSPCRRQHLVLPGQSASDADIVRVDRFQAECDRNAQTDVATAARPVRYGGSTARFHEAAQERERYGADCPVLRRAVLPRLHVARGDAPQDALRRRRPRLDLQRSRRRPRGEVHDRSRATVLVRWQRRDF